MKMKKILIVLFLLLSGCSANNNDVNNKPNNDEPVIITDGFVEYNVMGTAVSKGSFLAPVNESGNHYLAVFDYSGKLLTKEKIESDDRDFETSVSCYKQALDKKTYHYCQRMTDPQSRYAVSKLVIVDADKQKKDVYYLKDGLNLAIDPHDVIVFDENHYIICSVFPERIGDIIYQHAIIEEVSNRNVLWEFNSADYPLFMDSRYTDGDNSSSLSDVGDYMHFNSLTIDPEDGNLLVSFRNQCAIIKINRQDGSLMWVLGGYQDMFNTPSEAQFLYQHSISFTDEGNLLLLNNGAELENAGIMELDIDENNKTVKLVKKLDLGYPISNYGQVIKTKADTYIVQRGQSPLLDEGTGFDEIDATNGNINFSLRFGRMAKCYWVDYVE